MDSSAADVPRFFVMGTGLMIVNGSLRREGRGHLSAARHSYDGAALSRLRHVFRSSGDGRETTMALRLVEVLSRVQQLAGGKPLVVVSGYRSPEYNESIRAQGAKAAAGSLHTEGLSAADIALPRPLLFGSGRRSARSSAAAPATMPGRLPARRRRTTVVLGAGDVAGRREPSASNALLFARTEFDRYRRGEEVVVTLHSLTVPPVRDRPHGTPRDRGRCVDSGAAPSLIGAGADSERCVTADATGASLRLAGIGDAAHGQLCSRRASRAKAGPPRRSRRTASRFAERLHRRLPGSMTTPCEYCAGCCSASSRSWSSLR